MITAITILVALPFLIAFFVFLTNSLAGAMGEEEAFCQFLYAALCLLAVIIILVHRTVLTVIHNIQ